MAKSSRVCGSGLFHKVFTEGPLEVLISQCDAITAASLVGSSKSILQSAKYSATLPASQPFGLPCVLCCDPADKPWAVFKEDLPVHSKCKLLPLDRFSYDGLMPHGKDEERAGANGDWIAMVGPEGKWNLLNVYTHRKIKLPSLRNKLETTHNPLIFEYQRSAIQLQKIAICQVPTAARGYQDFSLVAIFDFAIAYLHGEYPRTWIFLENQFQYGAIYCDAIIHNGLVFAVTELGNVYAWDPNQFGPIVLPAPFIPWTAGFDDDDDFDSNSRTWWLARSQDRSRLLLVYARGVMDFDADGAPTYYDSTPSVHCGRAVHSYSGYTCIVFSNDTSRLLPANPWERVTNLGDYSMFLGLNYPIFMPVGGATFPPGYLTRRNCIYTTPQAIGSQFDTSHQEIFRFSLNGEDHQSISFSSSGPGANWHTGFWFIPSYTNALDWNKDNQS